MLPAVGARSLRCFAIRSLGIRRRQPQNGGFTLSRDTITKAIAIRRRESPSRHMAQYYDYISDDLTGNFSTPISRNALIERQLR